MTKNVQFSESWKTVICAVIQCWITAFDKDGNISNKNRHVYAFGDVPVRKGDYVVLYTKVGNDVRQTNANGTTSYFFYWNMLNHIWNNERDIAFLVHYDEWDRLESKD